MEGFASWTLSFRLGVTAQIFLESVWNNADKAKSVQRHQDWLLKKSKGNGTLTLYGDLIIAFIHVDNLNIVHGVLWGY